MQSLQEVFCRSLSLFQQGLREESEFLLRNGLEQFADAGCLWQLLGLVQGDCGAWREAMSSLERASHLIPLEPPASFTLAMCYLRDGQREMAVLVLRRLAVNPQTPQWLLPMIASNLGSLNEHVHALSACRQILRRDGRRHDAHFGVGFYFRKLGLPAERCLEAFWRAHHLAPRVGLYRIVIAGLLEDEGDADTAWDMLRGVDISEVKCPGALRRMMRLFVAKRDLRGWGRCQMRLDQVGDSACECDDSP